jgi:hypothetical protein
LDGEEIVKLAVNKQSELSNEQLAIRQANQAEGLKLSEDGEVETFDGDKVEVVGKLVEKYKEMMGDVAANLIAEEMKDGDVKSSELPEELSERM